MESSSPADINQNKSNQADQNQSEKQDKKQDLDLDLKKYKVLIVEDTIELAEVIQATLERMGIQVFHESHGAKALKQYETIQPDILLLDIGLPDMPGWKLLDKIKVMASEQSDKKLPEVIVITAYGDPANRLMGKLQDVAKYLIKPFTPNEVEQVVRKALRDMLARPETKQTDDDQSKGDDQKADEEVATAESDKEDKGTESNLGAEKKD